ncbi:MAG: hypothetical protein ACR2LY_03265 [Thermoleophilaceae bacterium]
MEVAPATDRRIPRLAPGAVAETLLGVAPDRDERASQLCVETLLTLSQNGYGAPAESDGLRSPKRERFAVRSLALGVNFLELVEEGRAGDEQTSPQRYGEQLAAGGDMRGSANLSLARDALEGLVDPETSQGQAGGWLLLPFHESLLWYDARRGRNRPWGVRKVYMRGSGITLARMLASPPGGGEAARLGPEAVDAIRETLQAPSPVARIADTLESALPAPSEHRLEDDERDAWARGGEESLAEFAERLCRHSEGVMRQGTASGPARLWQLRTVLALDLAVHALRASWDATEVASERRFLLLSFGGPPRAENRLRQRSEEVFRQSRLTLRLATAQTLARRMSELANEDGVDWDEELANRRERLTPVIEELRRAQDSEDFQRVARLAAETADYGRPSEGFRVLLQTIGMLTGTGRYRYLTATPDLLAALVGALSAEMPMSSARFFERLYEEWGLLVGQEEAAATALAGEVDGAELARNARRAEQRMADAGLALGLSDRTVVVGERARRGALA